MNKQLKIPAISTTQFVESVTTLNKKLAKIGCEITYGISSIETVALEYGKDLPYASAWSEKTVGVDFNIIDVVFPIEMLKHNDFIFKGYFAVKDGVGNIYTQDEDNFISEYDLVMRFHCSHCHSTRSRTLKAVFVNEKTDVVFYIGRSCLTKYLGKNAFKKLTAFSHFCAWVNTIPDKFYLDNDKLVRKYLKFYFVVLIAKFVIEQIGYVTEHAARYSLEVSTVSEVEYLMRVLNKNTVVSDPVQVRQLVQDFNTWLATINSVEAVQDVVRYFKGAGADGLNKKLARSVRNVMDTRVADVDVIIRAVAILHFNISTINVYGS